MTNLTDFLLARIAEDKARAERWRQIADDVGRLYGDPEPPEDDMNPADRAYFALHDAARRVLAECEAKRRIVERQQHAADAQRQGIINPGSIATEIAWTDALRLLALPYADHPAYREEWRP